VHARGKGVDGYLLDPPGGRRGAWFLCTMSAKQPQPCSPGWAREMDGYQAQPYCGAADGNTAIARRSLTPVPQELACLEARSGSPWDAHERFRMRARGLLDADDGPRRDRGPWALVVLRRG